MTAFAIFKSDKPTLRCAPLRVQPMDPAEQRILDELRRRRAAREQTQPFSTSLKGAHRD